MTNVLFTNVRILDGTGALPYRGDHHVQARLGGDRGMIGGRVRA